MQQNEWKVLIVEDDNAMAVTLSDGFQYEGHEVTLAKHEADIPASIREGLPEVVGDLRHANSARKCLGGAQIVSDIVLGEHFAGELHASALHRARAAQLALDLCRFEELCMQLEAFAHKRVHLFKQRNIHGNRRRVDYRLMIAITPTFALDSTPWHAALHVLRGLTN